MLLEPTPTTTSKGMLWTGRVLSGLAGLFMLFDGVGKIVKPQPVVEATVRLGYPESSLAGIGIALIVSALVYLYPRTSVLGAIVLTGYLGGAVASQVRINEQLFSIIFPVIFAAIVWGGLYLRNARLRALVPFVK
jgi:DoxX-like protein